MRKDSYVLWRPRTQTYQQWVQEHPFPILTHLPKSFRVRAGAEQSSSMGWPGLYSSFLGGSHPCSRVILRLGRPISSLFAAAAIGASSFFICSNAEVCTIKSCFAGRNMISRLVFTIL